MRDEDEPAITVVTRDGRRLTETVPFPCGSPANPLPDNQLIAKFLDLACDILAPERLEEIRDAILDLDMIADVRYMPALLKAAAAS